MRIITGSARGVRLRTLEGESTRPTAERTKEAIFSMLQFEIEGRRVLDAFAGSGQMGLEALSRGAESAVLVDKSKAAVDIIKKNAQLTRLDERAEVVCSDITECLKRRSGRERYDIVFLDPPYRSELVLDTVKSLLELKALKNGALVVCESGEPIDKLPNYENTKWILNRFKIEKNAKYGAAYVTFLRYNEEENENDG